MTLHCLELYCATIRARFETLLFRLHIFACNLLSKKGTLFDHSMVACKDMSILWHGRWHRYEKAVCVGLMPFIDIKRVPDTWSTYRFTSHCWDAFVSNLHQINPMSLFQTISLYMEYCGIYMKSDCYIRVFICALDINHVSIKIPSFQTWAAFPL